MSWWLFLRPERERHRRDDAPERRDVIPPDLFAQIKHCEHAEHRERDDLLHDLELRDGIDRVAPAVRRDHEKVFKERDAPAREDDQPERRAFEFQMAIPRERHENVRECQQHHGQPAGRGKIHAGENEFNGQRSQMGMRRFSAAEWRTEVAHGETVGNERKMNQAPDGAKEVPALIVCRPCRGWKACCTINPRFHRGLLSAAPPALGAGRF